MRLVWTRPTTGVGRAPTLRGAKGSYPKPKLRSTFTTDALLFEALRTLDVLIPPLSERGQHHFGNGRTCHESVTEEIIVRDKEEHIEYRFYESADRFIK